MGIRRMDKVRNARIKQLCGVTKGVDEDVLRWIGLVERMENYRTTKRVYVGELAGSRSVGRPRKRWIDAVKDSLKKKGLVVRHARTVWRGFVRGNTMG